MRYLMKNMCYGALEAVCFTIILAVGAAMYLLAIVAALLVVLFTYKINMPLTVAGFAGAWFVYKGVSSVGKEILTFVFSKP